MWILTGLLLVNNVDVYSQYGVFLSEKNPGEHENYYSLFKPSNTKEQVAINIREQDCDMLPSTFIVRFESRNVTLFLGI
jgi:hypothetical protein